MPVIPSRSWSFSIRLMPARKLARYLWIRVLSQTRSVTIYWRSNNKKATKSLGRLSLRKSLSLKSN